MKRTNSIFSILLAGMFVLSLSLFTSCGGNKPAHKRVKSGSGMGNKSHKNKHVWGK